MSTIRKKPSGNYEARYRDPTGRLRGKSFATRKEAKRFLDQVGTDIAGQTWRDPALGRVRLEEYSSWWLENRPELRPVPRSSTRACSGCTSRPTLGTAASMR